MSLPLKRRDLPDFGFIPGITADVAALVKFCEEKGYTSPATYNDVKASANSDIKDWLVANEYCKNTFFKEDDAPSLEGEMYKQLYLTGMDPTKRRGPVELRMTDAKYRKRRLDPSRPEYVPEADEHNFGVLNDRVEGPILEFLQKFKAPLARVRFAMLAPGFKIKPHIDYDPSYIVRYHVPLITDEQAVLCIEKNGVCNTKHLPADGKVYFFNSGFRHWAENNSQKWRLHLIVDVQNQDDLVNLQNI